MAERAVSLTFLRENSLLGRVVVEGNKFLGSTGQSEFLGRSTYS
jgi:hypothetical protein